MTLRPQLLVLALTLAASVGASCKRFRTIEELEESLGRIEAVDPDQARPSGGDPLAARFDRVRRLFAPTGSTPFGERVRFELSPRSPYDLVVELGPPVCYTVIATAVDDSLDADLRLDGPDGQPVAIDASPDAFPVIVAYCPEAAGPHAVRVTAARGSGEVMLGVFALPQQSADATRRLEALRARYAPTARALGAVAGARLAPGERHSQPVALLAGRCYAVAAVGADTVEDLDLTLIDEHETRLVRDLGVDAEPVLERFCPERGGAFRVVVEPYQGAGEVWWQVFELARGA